MSPVRRTKYCGLMYCALYCVNVVTLLLSLEKGRLRKDLTDVEIPEERVERGQSHVLPGGAQ